MPNALRTCMICGGPVSLSSLWLCAQCARTHGLMERFAVWPVWAKAMKRAHEQERRAERRRLRYEIDAPIEQLQIAVGMDGEK